MSFTNPAQTMLWLSFSAGIDDKNPYTKDCATAQQLYPLIQGRLQTLNSEYNAAWKVIWGPAIYSFPINLEGRHIDNVLYVVQNGDTNDYAFAIAGTDPYSLADWVLEDFLVDGTVRWPYPNNFQPTPRMSHGTSIGLTVLLNITPPCDPLPGVGLRLVSFLSTLTNNGPINIYTAGHSLGGALAPTLTLALEDLKSTWDADNHATLYPFAFAGPTPGDAGFAGYFQSKFPNLQRVWNSIDVVPHAWDTPHMKELSTLYGSRIDPVAVAVDIVLAVIEHDHYTPLNPQPATFTGTQQNPKITDIKEYFAEAAYQHTTAYLIWAGQDQWPNPSITV
ncbi:MAG: hypothetical protein DMF56_00830 [Acidobacteria bacterium]|nr:MAG: hypothetical protein DMF56_00830 [Acidobacteriota bacterium]